MSAAANAAGYLYAAGRIRGADARREQKKREAERAAEELRRERDQRKAKMRERR